MQAKRIQVNESNIGAGGQVVVALLTPTDPREEINFHNIWASASCEPQDTDANAQGTWVLLLLPENMVGINFTDAVLNGETGNATIIACGIWSASNQTPWNSGPIHPETSRTLRPGDQLILTCHVEGLTAGLASTRVMLCAHTTRK